MFSFTRSVTFGLRWILAPAVCLIVYSWGLRAWFQQDDFAHLGLLMQVHSFGDLIHALFRPVAQGTFRPISERGFFMAFYALFGLEAAPYRAIVFLTQIGNILLLTAVASKICGSRTAGIIAAILWTVNPTLSTPLSWTSAYNQVLWTFTILLAFYFLLRYWDTGSTRYNLAQWIVSLLGFGVLELNVSYAPLATAYALLCARNRLKSTLLLWIPAVAYSVAHFLFIPKIKHGVYALHLGSAMLQTFGTYWKWALGFITPASAAGIPDWLQIAELALATIALVTIAAVQAWRGSWLPLFFLSWFVITLSPVLPLTDHVTDYYVMVPAIGLAMAAGWALSRTRNPLLLGTGGLIAGVYLCCSIATAVTYSREIVNRSFAMKDLVEGVAEAEEIHPGKVILLTNVSDQLFWSGIYDHPFRFIGSAPVYVAPESASHLSADPDVLNIADYTLPDQAIVEGFRRGKMVVYAVGGESLQNVTKMYEGIATRRAAGATPAKVDVGNPLMQYLLDDHWYGAEGDSRWMPADASVRVAAPVSAAQKLHIKGFCAPVQVAEKPLTLDVNINGTTAGRDVIRSCGAVFDLAFDVPRSAVGQSDMLVKLSVDRAVAYGNDSRKLGLAIQTVEVR